MPRGTPDWSRQWFGYYAFGQEGFFAGGFVGGVGVTYGAVQLLNPGGSGKTAYITYARAHGNVASRLALQQQDAALANNIALSTANCKYVGKVAPSCLLYWERLAAPGAAGTFEVWTELEAPFQQEPIILDPGKGVMIVSNTATVSLTASYEWIEI